MNSLDNGTAFFAHSFYPPSFGGDPVAYALTVFGLVLLVLFQAEWEWRLLWSFKERPAAPGSAVVYNRAVRLLMSITVQFLALPTLVMVLSWPDVSAQMRELLSFLRSLFSALAGLTGAGAWWLSRRAGVSIEFELARISKQSLRKLRKAEMHQTMTIILAAFIIAIAAAVSPLLPR